MLLAVPFLSLPLQTLGKWFSQVDLIKAIGLPHLPSCDQDPPPRERERDARRNKGSQDDVGEARSHLCINGDVDLPLRKSPAVDRWSERLAFTRVTRVVTGHLLKCHRARRRASTSSRLLFCTAVWPLTSLCQGRCASLLGWSAAAGWGRGQGGSAVIVWMSVASRSLPHTFFLCYFPKRANIQWDDRLFFKAVQQHVIVSIYIIAKQESNMLQYRTCVKLKRRKHETCTSAPTS